MGRGTKSGVSFSFGRIYPSLIHPLTLSLIHSATYIFRGMGMKTRRQSKQDEISQLLTPNNLLQPRKVAAPKPARIFEGRTAELSKFLAALSYFHGAFIVGLAAILYSWNEINYVDKMWNEQCYWKIFWLAPTPLALVTLISLLLPYASKATPKRTLASIRNFYIVIVSKGDNVEAVGRSLEAHKSLEDLFDGTVVKVHVVTDKGSLLHQNLTLNATIHACPKSFKTDKAKHKARALEWYRQKMQFSERDWILHLDEESVIDKTSVLACFDFILGAADGCDWGQGVILYNQHNYWKGNWIFNVADSIRVADDLGRFRFQYEWLKAPVFGAHGSFLLTNGRVENQVTWDLGSLTEDYEFATIAQEKGFKCGHIAGAFVREQSPLDLMGFLKQRRRWFTGIRNLPFALPKVWAGLWAAGIPCLLATIVSYVFMGMGWDETPRWLGIVKDVTFAILCYCHILGILVQDFDSAMGIGTMLLHSLATILLSFVTVFIEAVAITYALVLPPKGFEVIRK